MEFLLEGLKAVTWQQVVMYLVGFGLIYLAIKKEYEPSLLLPMGFGAILVNLPFSGVLDQTLQGGIESNGIIQWLFHTGIEASEAMPILLFIGIGAMIDFGPLLTNPLMFLFGAGAQFGILRQFFWRQFWASILRMQSPLVSLEQRMVRPQSSYHRSLARSISVPSQWRLIPIWHWCRLFSHLPFVW